MERPSQTASSQRQARPVARPPVQRKQLSPALVLLAQVLGHAATDLREGAAHDAAEVALFVFS